MYHYAFPYKGLLRIHKLTERSLVEKSGLSRGCIRAASRGEETCAIHSVASLAQALGCTVSVIVGNNEGLSEFSSVATSMKIHHDGFASWKIHLMDFVDEYRRTLDPRLTLLPPIHGVDVRIKALLASSAHYLCTESSSAPPTWAERSYFLERPWFVSDMQALKASAIVESPLSFRRNNIFTQENFLMRV